MWWKSNEVCYSVLAVMVRDCLTTHVSTLASQSAFNIGGRVLDTKVP